MSHAPPLARPAVLTLLFFVLAAAFVASTNILVPRQALATQPPPPATYELTITKVGGDDNCKFGAEPPAPVQWEVTQFQRTYTASTQITLRQIIDCPSEYRFDHWESNEDAVDGQIDLQKVEFNISKNTWVKAHFVAVTPKVIDYAKDDMLFNPETGYLVVKYAWNSSSGNLIDLEGQRIIEVVAWDPTVTFDPDILDFLCTDQTSTGEMPPPTPWNEIWGDTVPRIWRGGTGAFAENPPGTDTHTRAYRPPSCNHWCSAFARQWKVAHKAGRYYFVGGPYVITWSFYANSPGVWTYCIEKHS